MSHWGFIYKSSIFLSLINTPNKLTFLIITVYNPKCQRNETMEQTHTNSDPSSLFFWITQYRESWHQIHPVNPMISFFFFFAMTLLEYQYKNSNLIPFETPSVSTGVQLK